MLLIALQYWNGDREQALRLARHLADIEPEFRKDVCLEFVLRFDATAPSMETLAYVGKKFKTTVYRCKRRGQGHPDGCGDVWHDFVNEMWARFLRVRWFTDNIDKVMFYEGDNVPLSKTWINEIVAEWEEARAEGKFILGCWSKEGYESGHINGACFVTVPDLFNRIKGLEGCPSGVAWDVFHGPKFEPHWFKSKKMINLYKSVGVLKSALFDKKGKPKFANCHGAKDRSVWELATEAGVK